MQKFELVRSVGALALSAALTAGAGAQKSTVSDAQVEANVLKALAGDTRLVNQPVNSSTAFGTVTLTGSVETETLRVAAEQIASRTEGVKKVVDQLTIGTAAVAAASSANTDRQSGQDYDPAAQNVLPGDQAADANAGPINGNQSPGTPVQQPAYGNPNVQSNTPAPNGYPQQQGYPQQPGATNQQGYPQPQSYPQPQGYPPQPNGYPQAGGYGQPQPRIYRRDYERQMTQNGSYGQPGYSQNGYSQQGGQPGGQRVTIAPGTVLPVRITRWLSSGNAEPGSTFTAVVENDILAGGFIAVPRGAEVQGTVVDATGAGALKGRGTLTLRLDTLRLGGQIIPLQSEAFTVNGHDKAAQSVNSTIGGAALGAIIGAVAGGGTGAAIGAGVGGAAGLGVSAASGGGNATLPAEAMLHFRLTAPADVTTVSETEMQRLGNYAGPAGARRPLPPPGYGYAYPGPYAAGPYFYGRPYRYGYGY